MVPALLFAQETPRRPARNKSLEIVEAIREAGIPLGAVRTSEAGEYTLEFPDTCSAQQRATPERIKREILAHGDAPIVVTNLEDALVVLMHEPDNESARALAGARYRELSAQARGQKGE